jgi:ABC-type uncharacterized transport system auxiliary subunit
MRANRKSRAAWRRRAGPALLFCAWGIVVAGCGASRPVKYYLLDPGSSHGPETTVASAPFPITLLVARLASPHLYRDDRLVYGSGAVQLGTYEYERWAEPPVEMVQDSLIASLRATSRYRSVSAIGSNVRGEYILRGRLYSLDEVDTPAIAARFSIELELFDSRAGATVWTDSYSHDEPVAGKTVPDVVEALDRNVRAGVQQLTSNLGQYFANHPPAAASSR